MPYGYQNYYQPQYQNYAQNQDSRIWVQGEVGATTDYNTLSIHDVVKVNPSIQNILANIALQLSVDATIESGNVTVKW